jgi:hypothetical protein
MKHVYVMGSTRYWFRYKIGISNNTKSRANNISKSIKGDAYVIFSLPFFFAENVEIFMHGIYRPLNARMKGSGKTEWFWLIFPISPLILLILMWIFQLFALLTIPIILLWGHNQKENYGKYREKQPSKSVGNDSQRHSRR